jgi:excinuclease UvrABC nuclease subunit
MKKSKFVTVYDAPKKVSPTVRACVGKSGCYIIKKNNDIFYIGRSGSNLYKTIIRHFQDWKDNTQIRVTYPQSLNYTIRVVLCTPIQSLILEKALILKHKPKDNTLKYEAFSEVVSKAYDSKVLDTYNNIDPF